MPTILHLWRWQTTPEPDPWWADTRPEPLNRRLALTAARQRCRELPQQQPLYLSRAVSASGRRGWFITVRPLAPEYELV
jgi:hypothetical protein